MTDGGVERALAASVCGMGGRLASPPADLAEALVAVDATYAARDARRLERFVAVPDGAFVWTQDDDGAFYLGRLAGPWRYDGTPAAHEVGLVHVRACHWLTDPIDPEQVPPAVTETFARGGRNFQRINRPGASEATEALWKELTRS